MSQEIPESKPKDSKSRGMWLTSDGNPPANLAPFYNKEDPRNEELKITLQVLTRMGIRNAQNVALAVVETLHEHRRNNK